MIQIWNFSLAIVLAASLLNVGDRAVESWETAYDHADFENARAVAESGYRLWRGRPQSRAYWRFRLALAESLFELDRLNEEVPLLETSAPSSEDEARRWSDLAMLHLRKQ